MQPKPETIITDNSHLDFADFSLVDALRKAGEDQELLTAIVVDHTSAELKLACQFLLSQDRTRGLQVLRIGEVAKSREVVGLGVRFMERDTAYYDPRTLRQAHDTQTSLRKALQPASKRNGGHMNGSK